MEIIMRLIYLLLYVLFLIGCTDPKISASQVGHFVSEKNIPVSVVTGFSNSQNYYTGDGTGRQADSVGFSAWVVVTANYPAIPTNDTQLIFGKTNHNANKVGWGFCQFQGETSMFVGGTFIRNDNDTVTKVNAIASTWDEVGKIQVIHGVVRHGKIYMYKNGVRSYNGFTMNATTMSFISSTKGLTIGSFAFVNSSNFYPYQSGIIACGISSTGLTDSQIESHYQALLNDVYSQATNTVTLFKASDAGSTWTDAVGGLVATRASSASSSTTNIPFYARYNPAERISDVDPILPALPNTAGALDVLFIGDSRTIGGTPHNSWRLGCYNMLLNDSRISNMSFKGPVFNSAFPMGYYAGYGGTSFMDFIIGSNGASTPATYMAAYDPDIIVIMLGVNNLPDVTQQSDFTTLVMTYYNLKPSLRFVFIEENNARFSGPTRDAQMQSMNNWRWRKGWVQLSQMGVKFVRVAMYNTLLPQQGDFILDAFFVHPTELGFSKMHGWNSNSNKGHGIAYGLLLAAGYKD